MLFYKDFSILKKKIENQSSPPNKKKKKNNNNNIDCSMVWASPQTKITRHFSFQLSLFFLTQCVGDRVMEFNIVSYQQKGFSCRKKEFCA